jgi:hypothetical protein
MLRVEDVIEMLKKEDPKAVFVLADDLGCVYKPPTKIIRGILFGTFLYEEEDFDKEVGDNAPRRAGVCLI